MEKGCRAEFLYDVLRVIAMGATNAVHPTIMSVLNRLLPHHVSDREVCASFKSRGYTDRQFRSRSAERDNRQPDDNGRNMKTFGDGSGAVL